MRTPILRLLFSVLLICWATSASAAPCALNLARSGYELAHPVLSGVAGPFRHVTLTLTRAKGDSTGPFSGKLDVGGKCLDLEGPDEPGDFFMLEVKAVLFTPIDATRTNGIVILYDSSQIGPQHGTDGRALVYRITPSAAQRQPALERRLAGVTQAAEARRRLAFRR